MNRLTCTTADLCIARAARLIEPHVPGCGHMLAREVAAFAAAGTHDRFDNFSWLFSQGVPPHAASAVLNILLGDTP